MIKLKVYSPSEINGSILNQIFELCDFLFSIDHDLLTSIIKAKDEQHLYFHKNKLIGIFGFKKTIIDSTLILYIGNAIIHPSYQKYGLLTKSIIRCTVIPIFFNPLTPKYCVAFSTTPHAYSYFTKLYEYWPQAKKETPLHINNLIKMYLESENIDDYKFANGVFIDNQLLNKIFPKIINTPNKNIEDYFNAINPNASFGAQVVCITPINLRNLLYVLKVYFYKKIVRLCR